LGCSKKNTADDEDDDIPPFPPLPPLLAEFQHPNLSFHRTVDHNIPILAFAHSSSSSPIVDISLA